MTEEGLLGYLPLFFEETEETIPSVQNPLCGPLLPFCSIIFTSLFPQGPGQELIGVANLGLSKYHWLGAERILHMA
jgi:hypothetical protein